LIQQDLVSLCVPLFINHKIFPCCSNMRAIIVRFTGTFGLSIQILLPRAENICCQILYFGYDFDKRGLEVWREKGRWKNKPKNMYTQSNYLPPPPPPKKKKKIVILRKKTFKQIWETFRKCEWKVGRIGECSRMTQREEIKGMRKVGIFSHY